MALPDMYDDGGFTGANTDRPAFKKLLDFNLQDLKHLRDEAMAQEKGWKDQRVWSETATKMLSRSRKAQSIGELSLRQQNELSRLAEEAWS